MEVSSSNVNRLNFHLASTFLRLPLKWLKHIMSHICQTKLIGTIVKLSTLTHLYFSQYNGYILKKHHIIHGHL